MISQYLALGDSMSIDLYPDRDAERRGLASPSVHYGAASLLVSNAGEIWPGLRGMDLCSLGMSGHRFRCLAQDGATSEDLVKSQLPSLPRPKGEHTLVTITAGGNDLLWEALSGTQNLSLRVLALHQNLSHAVSAIRERFSRVTIIPSHADHPSDGAEKLVVLRSESVVTFIGIRKSSALGRFVL